MDGEQTNLEKKQKQALEWRNGSVELANRLARERDEGILKKKASFWLNTHRFPLVSLARPNSFTFIASPRPTLGVTARGSIVFVCFIHSALSIWKTQAEPLRIENHNKADGGSSLPRLCLHKKRFGERLNNRYGTLGMRKLFICMPWLLNQFQPTQLRAMCRVTSELFKQKFDLTITSSNKSKSPRTLTITPQFSHILFNRKQADWDVDGFWQRRWWRRRGEWTGKGLGFGGSFR